MIATILQWSYTTEIQCAGPSTFLPSRSPSLARAPNLEAREEEKRLGVCELWLLILAAHRICSRMSFACFSGLHSVHGPPIVTTGL